MTALLSWNEIKSRAYKFVSEWKSETREKAESQSFWNDFFDIFGISRRRVVTFEKRVERLKNVSSRGFIDAFWPGTILIEHKSWGEDLTAAAQQATDYFDGLTEAEIPRAILVCDFEKFNFIDLDNGWNETAFSLNELPEKVELFGYLAGYEKQETKEELALNIKATELMGSIHDALEESGYKGHQLEVLLVRIMFCLFADDTSIFETKLFRELIETRTHEDGSDLGLWLHHLFQTLDTPEKDRQTNIDESLAGFPYVNGKLFSEVLKTASFSSHLREKILDACKFNWGQISPAIFGSLFQSVMDKNQRRNLGAHYTSEQNILRVIKPLFLDSLRREFEYIKGLKKDRNKRLQLFHDKLSTLKFLDPACGCGNFLVLAYRELRLLEADILKELLRNKSMVLDVKYWVKIDVDQMIGIEVEEWPSRIAETALWIMDHLMNRMLLQLGQVFVRLPLRKAPRIITGNALRLDWVSIVKNENVSHILGNPPYVGSKYQDVAQKADMSMTFGDDPGIGVLDYVCAWYRKAVECISGTQITCGFVSTSSIAQGEQVGILWREMQKWNPIIHFAHRPFIWNSEGRGTAHVHVVVIGFATFDIANKTLFDYPDPKGEPHEIKAKSINPYLVEGDFILLKNRTLPISHIPHAGIGNKPIDGGYYLFTPEEKRHFLELEPGASELFRRWMGSEEFLYNIERWCLWLGACRNNGV